MEDLLHALAALAIGSCIVAAWALLAAVVYLLYERPGDGRKV